MHDTPAWRLGDELADTIAELSPLAATFAGVPGHDHRWDDFSPAGIEHKRSRYLALAEKLSACERMHHGARSADLSLALRVMREHVDERLAFFGSDDPYLDLNHIASTFQLLPMALDLSDASTPEGLAAIATRMETMDLACAGYRALLSEGMARGAVVAKRQVESAVRQGRAHTLDGDHYAALVARIGASADEAMRDRLAHAAVLARAAIAELTTWLEQTYLPAATDVDAVGQERYLRAARKHLGTVLDLDETYAWAFDEIRRIEAEMTALGARIAERHGMAGASLRELIAHLTRAPESTVALPEPFLETMRARQAAAMSALAPHFDVPEPARRLDIKMAPPGGPVGAYYTAPSEDFSRPGAVWYSPGTRERMPLWQEITTAFHEGFPGHHLQVATQVFRREHLTRFQRLFSDWSGYAEGWALYAEQLMLELGLFASDEEILGMHAAQLARAYRVAVDIGLHLALDIPESASFHPGERWSFELAVEAMSERAMLGPEHAVSEVTRYLGWPGQAITYKVGQRAMLRLREARRAREGDAFDLRRFHADVLAVGTVGLDVLEREVLR